MMSSFLRSTKIREDRNPSERNLWFFNRLAKVQVARHPDRPYTMDYIQAMTTDFIEIHGDHIHRDDHYCILGEIYMGDKRVMIWALKRSRYKE